MSRRRLALLAVAAVLLVLFGGRWVAIRYTEHAWFADLGEGPRHMRLLARAVAWQLVTLAGTFGWYAAHMLGVYRSIRSVQLPQRLGNIEIAEAVPARTLRLVALGIAAGLAAATSYTFSDLDHYVALYRHATPLGITEPVLQHDAGFYVARLPLLESLHLLATIAVLLSAALVLALYVLTGSITLARRRLHITPHARGHLVVILVSLALLLAWGFHLDAYQLVAGGGSARGVLSAVDRAVRIPASSALSLLSLVVAAGSALALRWVRPGALLGLWATLAAAAILGRFLVPLFADAWGGRGSPEVAQALAQYADGYSRAAFGLLEVRPRPLSTDQPLREDAAAELTRAVGGVNVWSGESGLLDAALGAPAGGGSRALSWATAFVIAGADAGRPRPAVLAVPQADPLALLRATPRPTWTELHRRALAWGGEPVALDGGTAGGTLRYLASLQAADTAPVGGSVAREPGRIRFPARPVELAVVGPDEPRVGEPAPGVLLRGFSRRLLLAWALQTPALLSDRVSNADRVLYWRDVPARLSRLYPFAAFDPARPALVRGRLVWIADGYLASGRFPLAERLRWGGEDVNFLAAPFVATVDAVTGRTRLYLRPPDMNFAAGVAQSEGVVPLPSDSMGPELRRALVYPAGLFGAQTVTLARRNGDEGHPWSLGAGDTAAIARGAELLRPTSAWLDLEEDGERLWSLTPLAEQDGSHLAALVAGSVGPGGALDLRLLRLSGPQAPTPQAAATRLASAPALIAEAAASSGPEGSVHRGLVHVVPVGGTVTYVEVLFASDNRENHPLAPRGTALLVGDRVGFGADAPAAVRELLSPSGAARNIAQAGAALAEARAAFQALDSARETGDWVAFGRAWTALRRALRLSQDTARARP